MMEIVLDGLNSMEIFIGIGCFSHSMLVSQTASLIGIIEIVVQALQIDASARAPVTSTSGFLSPTCL